MGTPFIGENADGLELPVGFSMQLAQEPRALEAFGALSDMEKAEVIRYIQGGTDGFDAETRISSAIQNLRENRLGFFL